TGGPLWERLKPAPTTPPQRESAPGPCRPRACGAERSGGETRVSVDDGSDWHSLRTRTSRGRHGPGAAAQQVISGIAAGAAPTGVARERGPGSVAAAVFGRG